MQNEGYAVRRYDGPVKRYCRFLEIENDPELIHLYRECHGEERHWKEIRDGIRAVGILEMEMYITGRYVVMIVETAPDFDWDSAMTRLAQMPRQAEWETFAFSGMLARSLRQSEMDHDGADVPAV